MGNRYTISRKKLAQGDTSEALALAFLLHPQLFEKLAAQQGQLVDSVDEAKILGKYIDDKTISNFNVGRLLRSMKLKSKDIQARKKELIIV